MWRMLNMRAIDHVTARGKFVMFGSHAPYANLEIEKADPNNVSDDFDNSFVRTSIAARSDLRQLMMSYFNVRQ